MGFAGDQRQERPHATRLGTDKLKCTTGTSAVIAKGWNVFQMDQTGHRRTWKTRDSTATREGQSQAVGKGAIGQADRSGKAGKAAVGRRECQLL